MVYRAKITKIQAWVEDNYNTNVYTIVHDVRNVYIEVNDPDEADLLEAVNLAQEKLQELKMQWYEKYDN